MLQACAAVIGPLDCGMHARHFLRSAGNKQLTLGALETPSSHERLHGTAWHVVRLHTYITIKPLQWLWHSPIPAAADQGL